MPQPSVSAQESRKTPDIESGESLENKITRIVATSLQKAKIDLLQNASFRQNGGDSLDAIRIFHLLMNEGISLRAPDIMKADTLFDLPSLVISHRIDDTFCPTSMAC